MWKHRFRVTVFDESTYSEIRAFRGSPLNWMWGVVAAVGLIVSVTYVLLAFTPLREWLIPGYVAEQTRRDMRETRVLADSLALLLGRQELALLALRHTLVGDEAAIAYLTTTSETSVDSSTNWLADSSAFEVGLRELELRGVVEEEDRFALQRRIGSNSSIPTGFSYPPVVGGVSDRMQPGIGHLGVDLVAAPGSAVQAVEDGSVLFSSYTVETGYTLLIQHRGERVSVYKHCSSLLKRQGDLVAGGEAVGLIGNTGELSTGPHLHFEWWVRGRAVDPTPWLGQSVGLGSGG